MGMAQAGLTGSEWSGTVERLGGAGVLEEEARATKAFRRPREVKCGVDLLRLILAYCLGAMGLRLTAAWAEGIGLASLSNVALLGRLRNAGPWLQRILERLLAQAGPVVQGGIAGGRLIRLVDATTVRKAGKSARESGRLWRVHAIFDLPTERFSAFELTDEKGAERINRMAVIAGELRIGDAIHCRADELADVMARGGDVLVRAGWTSAHWQEADGRAFDMIRALADSATGQIDRTIWLRRKQDAPLKMRLVAVKMPKEQAVKAVAKARAEARSAQRTIQPGTLVAAEWVILVTSVDVGTYTAAQVLELYRLRWRIEIAFKRLKSLADLAGPPGECPEVAKAWVLCHLIAALLTEAQLAAFGDSPRRMIAHVPTSGVFTAC
jgi:Transposase DDE domain